jgi:RimJ/RimL family protein N-acetyltransferase
MIRLEYFTREDFQQLMDWVHNEHLITNWAGSLFSYPLSHSSLEWYIDETNDLSKSDAFVYKAIDSNTGNIIGHVSLGSVSRKNHSARISRVLVGEQVQRGKGYCTSMINAVLKVGFEQLQLHRISLGVYDFNTAAIRCYEKCGFVKEGISRDVLRYGNEYWSLVEMSILDNEWRKIHHDFTGNEEGDNDD